MRLWALCFISFMANLPLPMALVILTYNRVPVHNQLTDSWVVQAWMTDSKYKANCGIRELQIKH